MALAGAVLASACGPLPTRHRGAGPTDPPAARTAAPSHAPSPSPTPLPIFSGPALSGPHLQPGSNPSVLPGPILIADNFNNRLLLVSPHGRILWAFPQPGALAPGQTFIGPDDAFFSPGGRQIVVTEESNSVVSIVNPAVGRIAYRYGTPGVPGAGPNQLSNPDDAMMLPNHDLLMADIKNCRLLLVAPGAHVPARIYGQTTPYCYHAPPQRWGSPNGVFPMRNGNYLVTEINGDWVDEMNLAGQVIRSWHPPGVRYPSDTNQVRPGVYLVADYSSPGQIEMFNRQGVLLWRYRPLGAQSLNHPSIALPLPNGDILATDDRNDRVIVIDPRTHRIVWQYGVTGVPGSAPGYLNNPDGVDLAPPYSLDMVHAATMGLPPP